MCGIAGIVNIRSQAPASRELLCRMIAILRHRGPDETGIYVDTHVGLGHARLSIIGIETGIQPICNEDGTLWIVYNGEVFNYLELREVLTRKGHAFSTETDTEVLLHLYEEYGARALEMLNGQFAFAIWDARAKELFLARDRVGIRPLYYGWNKGDLLFASEIKAIFLEPAIARAVDPEALAQVFTFWSTVTPRTAFREIRELPPGHYLRVSGDRLVVKPYWSVPYYPVEERWHGSFEEAKEELRSLLEDSVRLRLRADVPVGAYLSGGLDSSILTSLISRSFNNRLRSFSMGFQEGGFDESPFQQELVQHLGTEHSQVLIGNSDIRDHLPRVVWHCETPVLRTAPVPLSILSGLARSSGFKVVLTGEGADEIFGGYNIFKEAKVRNFWGRMPESRLRPLLLERLYPYIFRTPSQGRYFLQKFFAVGAEGLQDPLFSHRIRWSNGGKNRSFFSAHLLAELSGYQPLDEVATRLPAGFNARDLLSKAQLLEMEIFLSSYLLSSQGDRVAMANSLELRHPFLDYRVIDFAFRLPATWKIRGLEEKYILKRAFRGIVPESITSRAKQPYRAPVREVFFSNGTGGYADELLSEECIRKAGYFDPSKVTHLVTKFRKDQAVANESQNMALMGILSTQLLHGQFIDDFPFRDVVPVEPDKAVVQSGC